MSTQRDVDQAWIALWWLAAFAIFAGWCIGGSLSELRDRVDVLESKAGIVLEQPK